MFRFLKKVELEQKADKKPKYSQTVKAKRLWPNVNVFFVKNNT